MAAIPAGRVLTATAAVATMGDPTASGAGAGASSAPSWVDRPALLMSSVAAARALSVELLGVCERLGDPVGCPDLVRRRLLRQFPLQGAETHQDHREQGLAPTARDVSPALCRVYG